MEYRDKLRDLGITLTRSGKQTCPQCSHLRKNKTDPCLSVTYTDEAVLYNVIIATGQVRSIIVVNLNKLKKLTKDLILPK